MVKKTKLLVPFLYILLLANFHCFAKTVAQRTENRFLNAYEPQNKDIKANPHILIHGWGWVNIDLRPYGRFLEQAGVPRERIHYVTYDCTQSFENIEATVSGQFRQIIGSYAPSQKFEVIGHSFGQFLAMYSLARTSLSTRINQLVGLAGVAHGEPDFIGCHFGVGFLTGQPTVCGGIETIIGSKGQVFLAQFYEEYRKEINAYAKCSLASPEDYIIKEYPFSGFFENGINIIVHAKKISSPLYWKSDIHFRLIQESDYFELMKSECYPF